MNPSKPEATPTRAVPMAEQIAVAARAFQQERTGLAPKAVGVVIDGNTLVVTLKGALSPAEQAMAQTPEGAATVREFHRQLFLTSSSPLREAIKRITGLDVQEAATEVNPKTGEVIQILENGTMVQVFLLSGKSPASSFSLDPINLN